MKSEEDIQRQYDLLVRRHLKLIRFLCRRRSRGDAYLYSELTQEVFLDLWSNMPLFNPSYGRWAQRRWVEMRCRGVFSRWLRGRRDPGVPLEGVDDLLAESPPDDLREVVEELAAGLSPRERQVLDLLMEDYSVGEIAAMLGLGPRNVSQIRQRIIKKMRKNSNKNQCL